MSNAKTSPMTYIGALFLVIAVLAWVNDMQGLPMWSAAIGLTLLGLGWLQKKKEEQKEAERTKNQQGAFAS